MGYLNCIFWVLAQQSKGTCAAVSEQLRRCVRAAAQQRQVTGDADSRLLRSASWLLRCSMHSFFRAPAQMSLDTCRRSSVCGQITQKSQKTCEGVSRYLRSRLRAPPEQCQGNCTAAAGQLRCSVSVTVQHRQLTCAATSCNVRRSVRTRSQQVHGTCGIGGAPEMQLRPTCAAASVNLRHNVGAPT